MSSFTLSLNDVSAIDAARVGGKALHLGELRQAGVHVPSGFVITADAYREFLQMNGPERELESLLRRLDWESLETRNEMVRLQERLRTQPLSPAVREAIADGVSACAAATPSGSPSFAVRSSALSEDSAEASFAGQYDTFLNCVSLDQVLDGVRACWASLWNERAVAYRLRSGQRLDVSMGVVVQVQVSADVSGVMFTLNPLTGHEGEMTVESSWGLGEAVVSGRITPDQFIVNWVEGRVLGREIADKPIMTVVDASGTREVPVAEDKRGAPSLDDRQLLSLAQIGERIQTLYGAPQDVEWAMWQDEFYVLQARPLTSINYTADYGQWTSANFREVMPGFVSPLSASVSLMHDYPRALSELMGAIGMIPRGQSMTEGRLIFGRAFWRFDRLKEALAQLPGFKERAFDETVGIEPSYEGDGRSTPFNPATMARGLPMLLKLDAQYKSFWKEAKAFQESFGVEEKEFLSVDRARLNDEELAAWIRKTLDLHWRTNRIALKVTFLSTQAQDDLRVMLELINSARPPGSEPVLMPNLLTGLGNVKTARPIAEIEKLAQSARREKVVAAALKEASPEELPARLQSFPEGRAFWAQFGDFIQRFRFLAEVDEDFALARYDEDATIPLRVLRQNLDDPPRDGRLDTQAVREQEQARAKELRARFARGLLGRFWTSRTRVLDLLAALTFDEQLETVRRYTWWREETRELIARAHYLCRRFFLELGRRWAASGLLDDADEVFLLTRTQILDALDAGEREPESLKEKAGEWCAGIRRYRRMRKAYRNLEVPWTVNVVTRARVETPGAVRTSWTGVPCGPGRVCAPARIILDPKDGCRLQKGEVLVAPYTNPNWTPLFSLAAGIVMEEGGLLSHGSVIARELGIPAVLQIKRATQVLRDGQMLCVDGTTGVVQVVSG